VNKLASFHVDSPCRIRTRVCFAANLVLLDSLDAPPRLLSAVAVPNVREGVTLGEALNAFAMASVVMKFLQSSSCLIF